MKVYRIQDREGRGPFRPGMSKFWASEGFEDGIKPLPTFAEEFGPDIVDRLGRPGEWFGSAVRTREDINRWFSKAERERLHTLGYKLVRLSVDRILAESENQLVFARRRHLRLGAQDVGLLETPTSSLP